MSTDDFSDEEPTTEYDHDLHLAARFRAQTEAAIAEELAP